MDRKIRVGAVSYLNTKPLIYGIENGALKDELDLVIDYPSKIAMQLVNDEIDVGLVPVAIIPSLKEWHIISDYGISCDGVVASVCLFSEVPVEEIENIYLDYQSRTSVALLKVLLKEHWKISPVLIAGKEGYENEIKGKNAGLVIGDRAFKQRLRSAYHYDLGLAWKELTGKPFIFAAWISNKQLPEDFKQRFNKVNEIGLKELDTVINEHPYDLFDLFAYYTDNIKFRLPEGRDELINLFLEKVKLV